MTGGILNAAILLGAALLLPWPCLSQTAGDDAAPVLLSDIEVLVFEEGEYTSSRVGNTFPKLNDIGDPRSHPKVSRIVCKSISAGFAPLDNLSITWNCSTTNLGRRYTLADTHVSCEGWSGPGDVYIVPGSCALEYKVVLNPAFGPSESRLTLGPESLYRTRRWEKRIDNNLADKREDNRHGNSRLDDL